MNDPVNDPVAGRQGHASGASASGGAPAPDERALPTRAPAPWPLLVLAGLTALFLILPLVGLLAAAPWDRFVELITRPESLQALWLSVWTSAVAAALCAIGGTPLGWVLARREVPGRRWLRGLVLTPLVLPPVVAGVALLAAFGRNGLVGGPLRDLTGLTIPYSTLAVVLAHTFVAMPFFVLAAESAFRLAPQEYDDVAGTLGAGTWRVFRTVTLPLAAPGLAAASVLAFARSLGEFGATITFAGNYPGTTRTLSLEIYTTLQDDFEAPYALAVLLMLVSVATLVLLRERWWGALR
ncbi:ABC transporter permease [Alteromonas gracilis]